MRNLIAASTTAPLYADRVTGEKFADAMSLVNAYLARYAGARPKAFEAGAAGDAALDETGYAQVKQGSATIGINVLDAQANLLLGGEIAVRQTRVITCRRQ